jgi:hypothetical protein
MAVLVQRDTRWRVMCANWVVVVVVGFGGCFFPNVTPVVHRSAAATTTRIRNVGGGGGSSLFAGKRREERIGESQLLLLLFAVALLLLLLLLFIDFLLWVDRPASSEGESFWQVRSRTAQAPAAIIIVRFDVVGMHNFMIRMMMVVAGGWRL